MSKSKSKNPAYPDADPTAPGGMSQQALADELADKHGWSTDDLRRFRSGKKWNLAAWPEMIDAVVEERLVREREQSETPEGARASKQAVAAAGPDLDDDDLDPEALLAEMAQAQAEAQDDEPEAPPNLLVVEPGTLNYLFDGHWGAGPSAAERWMHCTASLGASRAFLETLTPNQQAAFAVSSTAARQGTTAHAAAEIEARMVLGEVTQSEVDMTLLELTINPAQEAEAYDEEMAEYIGEYVDLVKSYAQDRGDDHVLIEQRVSAAVPLTGLFEGEVYEITGSGDCVVLPTKDDPTLVVSDLKYGNGIDVDVEENPQVRIYALGALGLLADDEGNLITPVEDVTYHIAQPRSGGLKTWSEPLGDLLQWRDEVLAPALTAALHGPDYGATFNPSESACQFCPARGTCSALAEHRIESAAGLFDTIVEAEYADGPGAFPETTSLPAERLGELLTQITGLMQIHKDLKAEAERRLFRGEQVPGYHLVNYSPPRKWTEDAEEELDESGLKRKQIDALFTRKLVTPTAAEKLLGEEYKMVESLVEKPEKRPVIAPEGDRRKPWTGRPPEAMFDVEED